MRRPVRYSTGTSEVTGRTAHPTATPSAIRRICAVKHADVSGDTPNMAAGVQEAAAAGTVVVTEDTHRLVSGLFVVEARGSPALKGIERPLQLYRVIQASGVRDRLAAAAAHGLTP